MEGGMEEMLKAEIYEKELAKEKRKFAKEFVRDVLDVLIGYYPEAIERKPFLERTLISDGEIAFGRAYRVLNHYFNKREGYYRERKRPMEVFDVSESPREIQHACNGMSPEYREEHYEICMGWYLDEFNYKSCRLTMFNTIKKLVVQYFPDIYDMPAQAFRELNEEMCICMGATFAMIRHRREEGE